MILKYKIIEVHPNEHSVVVRFYTDKITEESLCVQKSEDGKILRCRTDYNIELPIPAPTGGELDELISKNAPKAFFAKLEAVLDPKINTSLQNKFPLIGVEKMVCADVANAPAHATTLDVEKALLVEKISKRRDEIICCGVEFEGNQYDTDSEATARLTTLVTTINAGIPMPLDFSYRTSANNDIKMSELDVKNLLSAIVKKTDATFKKSWDLKSQANSAISIAELSFITWVDATAKGSL